MKFEPFGSKRIKSCTRPSTEFAGLKKNSASDVRMKRSPLVGVAAPLSKEVE